MVSKPWDWLYYTPSFSIFFFPSVLLIVNLLKLGFMLVIGGRWPSISASSMVWCRSHCCCQLCRPWWFWCKQQNRYYSCCGMSSTLYRNNHSECMVVSVRVFHCVQWCLWWLESVAVVKCFGGRLCCRWKDCIVAVNLFCSYCCCCHQQGLIVADKFLASCWRQGFLFGCEYSLFLIGDKGKLRFD